ncbi:MAG TPA: elongation factor G, partial [Flavihumibacter sp.]|nr:elongation factor G [Flavihumibacter sp.]
EGPLTGSYVRDIRVSVYDGKMHAVDSNDISFKIAGLQAFRAAFKEADPQLLEPIYDVEVTCPDELTGAVIGDIQIRRGIVDGMDAEQRFTRIHAKIPLAELHDFSASLRSITQGRARFSMQPFSYKPVPGELQNKLAGQYASSQHLAEV